MLETPSKKQEKSHYIPSDVIENIMAMLPVKSLVRFRSVSKTWRSLIDEDRDFLLRHLHSFNKTQKQKLQVLRYESDSRGGRFSVGAVLTKTFANVGSNVALKVKEPIMFEHGWEVVCAADGLYMLQKNDKFSSNKVACEFMLWNPSIRKYRILPPPPRPPSAKIVVYDIGLGFDPSTKDYKYVGFAWQYHGTLSSVLIYSLATNSWKPNSFETNGCPKMCGYRRDSKVCFAGVLYSLQVMLMPNSELTSYDLSTDKFCCADLPSIGYDGILCHTLTLDNAGTCLELVTIMVEQLKGTIWLSQKLGGEDSKLISWTIAYTFTTEIPRNHPYFFMVRSRNLPFSMRFVHLNDEDAELLLSWNSHFLISHNLKTRQEKMLLKSNAPFSCHEVHPYAESLLLLN